MSQLIVGWEQWDLYNWALVSILRALEEGDEWKTRELRQFRQFLLTFHPGFQKISRTTHLNA